MSIQAEWLNQEMERTRRSVKGALQIYHPPVVQALALLARALQMAPALQVDPAYARRLERRILAHQAALRGQGKRTLEAD